MSTSALLIDGNFNAGSTPHSGGSLNVGTRMCAPGPGTYSVAANGGNTFPAYTIVTDALRTTLPASYGFVLNGPGSLPTLAAGLGWKFSFAVSALADSGNAVYGPVINFTIGGVQLSQYFFMDSNGDSSLITGLHNQGVNVGASFSVTFLIRRQVGSQWEVETWASSSPLSLFPVCIDRNVLTLADGSFSVGVSCLTSNVSTDTLDVQSVLVENGFALDPTASGANYFSYVATGNQGGLGNSTAGISADFTSRQGQLFYFFVDALHDPSGLSRGKLLTSADKGKSWTESLFSGNDLYGNTATGTLSMFDLSLNANPPALPLATVQNGISLACPSVPSGTVAIGNQGTRVDYALLSSGTIFTLGPFTAIGTGSLSALLVLMENGQAYDCQVFLCAYSGSMSTNGGVGAVLGASGVQSGTGAGTHVSFNFSPGAISLVAGSQYVIALLGTSGECSLTAVPAGTTSVLGSGTYSGGSLTLSSIVIPSFPEAIGIYGSYTGTGGLATLTQSSGGLTTLKILDSSGGSYTNNSATNLSGLVTAINNAGGVGHLNSGYWTAAATTNPYNSSPTGCVPTLLLPTNGSLDCSTSTKYLTLGNAPQSGRVIADSSGIMLLVSNRWQSIGQNPQNAGTYDVVTMVGRFYDGTWPYDPTHWGPEFIIGGGPTTGGTPNTGGDAITYGDIRGLIKLRDGRYAMSLFYENCTTGTPVAYPVTVISKPGLTWQQLQGGVSLDGWDNTAQTGGGTPSWVMARIAQSASVSYIGSEPAITELPNGNMVCVARNGDYLCMSVGILQSDGTFSWVDPTCAANTSYDYCVCDGSDQSNASLQNNTLSGYVGQYQRPLLWAGGDPAAIFCDNTAGTVHIVTGTVPFTNNRSAFTDLQTAQSNFVPANIVANAGLKFTAGSYGTLISTPHTTFGYGSFKLNDKNVFCGAIGELVGAGFFLGSANEGGGGGGGGGRLGLGL